MAERRMFTKKVSDSDSFIEMPSAAQALYFHLNQGADDDGFNNQVQIAMIKAHASLDDLKVLMMKNFIIRFDSGVIVIKHWRMHNTLRKDRYTPTNFQEELSLLGIKDNGAYTLGCQMVAKRLPQDSIGKDSIVKDSVNDTPSPKAPHAPKHKKGEFGNVRLTEEEEKKLIDEYGESLTEKAISFLDEYIEEKGYKANSHYLSIRRWVIDAVKEREPSLGNSFDTDDFFAAALARSQKGETKNERN